jgi:LuxR family transcriptional regulator, maltose regulon positive regulatory protein
MWLPGKRRMGGYLLAFHGSPAALLRTGYVLAGRTRRSDYWLHPLEALMAKSPHRVEAAPSSLRPSSFLEAGRSALQRGAWAEAAEAFSLALAAVENRSEAAAEAWAGIGLASYWLIDAARSTAAFERAFRLYRDLGRRAAAARTALWLTDIHLALYGGYAVANGWSEQAGRLLAGSPPSAEHAWLLAYRGHFALFVTGDAALALKLAREGQAVARTVDAADVEVVALALEGLALVQLGEVEPGMARLDEASAAAVTRGLADLNAVAWACCYLVHGCGSIRDLPRAEEWCRRVLAFCDEWGLAPIYATCRIDYATVLTWRGAWDAAETELVQAGDDAQHASPGLERLRQVRLAELRRRQGCLDEAEQLLSGAGEDLLAIVGRAAVALDREQPAVALDLSDRVLRLLPPESWLERIDALLIRARAAAALGDAARAADAAGELAGVAERAGTALLRGTAAYARGIAARTGGDVPLAVVAMEEAVAHSEGGGAPYEAAHARLELAAALAQQGRHETARREAAHARDVFASLGAARDVERADAFLCGPFSAPASAPPLTRREIEVLRIVARGWSNPRIAAELVLSPHTVKRHVSNILMKLDCSSRAAAVARGARLGLLT